MSPNLGLQVTAKDSIIVRAISTNDRSIEINLVPNAAQQHNKTYAKLMKVINGMPNVNSQQVGDKITLGLPGNAKVEDILFSFLTGLKNERVCTQRVSDSLYQQYLAANSANDNDILSPGRKR